MQRATALTLIACGHFGRIWQGFKTFKPSSVGTGDHLDAMSMTSWNRGAALRE
jgi:hypothetical protein